MEFLNGLRELIRGDIKLPTLKSNVRTRSNEHKVDKFRFKKGKGKLIHEESAQ